MSATVVHEHAVLSYEVSMEILNFEVVDLNRLIELLNSDGMDERRFPVSQFQLVVRFQIDRRDSALVVHIERMLGGAGNCFIANLNVDKLILFIQEGLHHALQRAFAGIGILRPCQPIVRLFYQINTNTVNKKRL